MKPLLPTLGLAGLVMALTGTAYGGIASAAPVDCGSIITQDTTLTTDIGPCGVGLTIRGEGVVLDLGGHTVRGNANRAGDSAGILFDGTDSATVRNGTVTEWNAGVVMDGGSANTVRNVRAVNNVSNGLGLFGDGIFVFQSDGAQILDNAVIGNGPFSGITLDDSSGSLVDSNSAQNNVAGTAIGIWILNDQDVSPGDPDLVGRQASFNLVSNNQVQGNALEGIQISRFATHNTLYNNNTSQNGTFTTNRVRDGNGIAVFGNENRVEQNIAFGNGANGIVIFRSTSSRTGRAQGVNNTLVNNRAQGNDVGPNPAPSFDLLDQSPACDNNQWHGNLGQRISPPCTLNP